MKGICINDCTYIFKAPMMINHCPLMLWYLSSNLRTKSFPVLILQCQLCLLDYNMAFYSRMENSQSTLHLARLFLQWNTAVYRMNYWVCRAGRHRPMSVLERVHAAFFTSHQMQEMIYIPDESILARMMTVLDLEFEKAMYHHNEEYKSNHGYGLPLHIMRPISVYSVFKLRPPLLQLNST